MPSKDINQHNPAADRSDIDRLKALRKRLGMTWRGFYAESVPILEDAYEQGRYSETPKSRHTAGRDDGADTGATARKG